MDLRPQTTVANVSPADLEQLSGHLQRLLDRAALLDLSSLYSMGVDDHDLQTVVDSFATEGTFVYQGAEISGHAALRDFYAGMMDRYALSRHVPNMHVFSVDSETTAHGLVSGTAELVYQDVTMVAAYRYDDDYVKVDGRWVFERRLLRFLYTVPWDRMVSGLAGTGRIAWPDAPVGSADLPETLPTWSTYRQPLTPVPLGR